MIFIKTDVKILLFLSVLYTLSVIGITITITSYLDKIKTEDLIYEYRYEFLQLNDYDLTLDFLDIWREEGKPYNCEKGKDAIKQIVWYMREIGSKLSRYGESSTKLSEKDFDYLKRKYYLLELKEYLLLKKLKEKCNEINIILFFYKREDKNSQIMGRVLAEAASDLNDTYVLAFDIDYQDISLLNLIKERFNVSSNDAPVFIVNDKSTYKGLYTKNEVIRIIEEG